MGPAPTARGQLVPGTRVDVYNSYALDWARGFEVSGVDAGGYRVRRVSDGTVLPVPFAPDALRPVTPR